MGMYDFNEVVNSNPRPLTIRERIKAVLGADHGACYDAMEGMLMGNYSGSLQFDKAYAVDVLLEHDANHGNHVAQCMITEPQQNRRQIWNHLSAVLKQSGFEFKGGALVGTRLEHQPAEEVDAA